MASHKCFGAFIHCSVVNNFYQAHSQVSDLCLYWLIQRTKSANIVWRNFRGGNIDGFDEFPTICQILTMKILHLATYQ